MKNLHHFGIRHNTPWFLEIIKSLGVDVQEVRNARELRRFILGDKLTPIDEPQRGSVPRSAELEIDISSANNIDDFFTHAKSELVKALLAKGIELSSVTHVETTSNNAGGDAYFIEFNGTETDAELTVRKEFADTFNKLLAIKDEIYAKINEHLGIEQ